LHTRENYQGARSDKRIGVDVPMNDFETVKEETLYSVKRYYIEPGKTGQWIDLVWYYLILADRDIPNYRTVWSNLVGGRFPDRYRRELLEYMHGAHERYKQALFARDIIGKLVMKYPDNDVLFIINLHMYYFITVVKALADNLALILNYFYDIGLESSPDKIDITKEPFRARLRDKSTIFDKVCQGPEYEAYKTELTEFRDVVVHRHALHIVRVLDRNGQTKIMVPRDPSRGIELRTEQGRLGTKYAVSRDRKSIAKYGVMTTVISPDPTKNYEEPMEFCSRHLRFIANSYTAVLAEMARASGDQSKN
jgi:hypothetical protein